MKLVSLQKLLKVLSFMFYMENKNVGWLIIGISALIVGIILLFNNAMKKIIDSGCTMMHDEGFCPAYATINQQTYLSLSIVGILVIIGIFLIFSKPKEKIVIRRVKDREVKRILNTNELSSDEKKVLGLVQSNKAIFQSDLIEKTSLGKAKMTRIIDRLEGKGFVERKRRGMTNIVVLKD